MKVRTRKSHGVARDLAFVTVFFAFIIPATILGRTPVGHSRVLCGHHTRGVGIFQRGSKAAENAVAIQHARYVADHDIYCGCAWRLQPA